MVLARPMFAVVQQPGVVHSLNYDIYEALVSSVLLSADMLMLGVALSEITPFNWVFASDVGSWELNEPGRRATEVLFT